MKKVVWIVNGFGLIVKGMFCKRTKDDEDLLTASQAKQLAASGLVKVLDTPVIKIGEVEK